MSAPARFDFVGAHAGCRGLTFSRTVSWQDSAGDPISLAGMTPRLFVLQRPDLPTVLLDCTVGNGRIAVADPSSDGILTIDVDAATMGALPAGRHVYQLRLTNGAGDVIGLLAGWFDVLRPGEGATQAPPGDVTVRGESSVVVVSHGTFVVGGGGGVSAHGDLTGRSAADSHPISAITGLQAQLTALAADIAACATGVELAALTASLAGTAASLASHIALAQAHGISAFGSTLVDDANAAAARATLGVVIGTDVQAHNTALDSVSAGTWVGGTSITTLGAITVGAWQGTSVGVSYGGTGANNATDARSNLGAASAVDLSAHTGSNTAHGITSFAATILDDTTASAVRSTIGVVIGTDVQAYSATLTAWAAKTVPTGDVVGSSDAQTLTSKTWGSGTKVSLGSDGTGDIWYRAADGTLTRLAAGTNGHVLTLSTGLPSWAAPGGGLSEPLTSLRFTGQTSAPLAAAANELKAFVRLRHKRGQLVFRNELGDPMCVWETPLNPFVRSFTFGGTTSAKNISSTAGAGTSAVFAAGIRARNFTTAATANVNQRWFPTENGISTGSGLGDGFLFEAFFALPDASYGSGATGAAVLVCVSEILATAATTGARPSAGSGDGAYLHWSTSLSDTTFKCVVNDGGVQTVADLGVAATPQNRYHVIIWCPRGSAETHFYLRNMDTGVEGTATIADVPISTTMLEVFSMVTLDAVARSLQVLQFSTTCGGEL